MTASEHCDWLVRVEAVRKRKIYLNKPCRRAPECLESPPLPYARLLGVIEFVAVCSNIVRQMRVATRSAQLIVP